MSKHKGSEGLEKIPVVLRGGIRRTVPLIQAEIKEGAGVVDPYRLLEEINGIEKRHRRRGKER